MIGRLCGKVASDEPAGSVLLDVAGVGYELNVPIGTLGRAEANDSGVVLIVHTHVREDALELFGFASELDRRVFRLLLAVPNVGPKTALGVLSALPPPELASAIAASNVSVLTKIPGIGKKTAERLVLELKDKLDGMEGSAQRSQAKPPTRDDAQRLLGALTNMGYRPAEAERTVAALKAKIGSEPLDKLLKEALALLTR